MTINTRLKALKSLAAQIDRELLETATPLDTIDYELSDERVILDAQGNLLDGYHRVAGMLRTSDIDDEIEVIVCDDEILAEHAANPERPELQAAALLIIHHEAG